MIPVKIAPHNIPNKGLENAKIFNSNSEFRADISTHFSSLNSILKETGQILHVQKIE